MASYVQRKGRAGRSRGMRPWMVTAHPEYDVQKEQMNALGQDWSICEYIGHIMNEHDRARVSRTSSQDAGVDRDAEITIATASLEVGFNDPEVGEFSPNKK